MSRRLSGYLENSYSDAFVRDWEMVPPEPAIQGLDVKRWKIQSPLLPRRTRGR